MKRAITAVSILFFSAQGHAAEKAESGARLNWDLLDLAYVVNYTNTYGPPELREKSLYGWRAKADIGVFPAVYLTGSYDYQFYDIQDGQASKRERYAHAKYGAGSHGSIGWGMSAVLQITWQERVGYGLIEDPFSGADRRAYAARGFGYFGGLRTALSGGAELSVSYELAPLKSDAGNIQYKEHFETVALEVVAPLSRAVWFTLGFEHSLRTDKNEEIGLDEKTGNENILLGLRLAI